MILTLASSRRAASQSVETSGSSVVDIVMDEYPFNVAHGRACPGHPRLHLLLAKTWMPGTKPTAVWHGLCLKRRTALILLVSSWLRIIWTREGINAVRHQNIVFHGLLKHIPWPILDRLVDQYNADWDGRVARTKAHLIAMLYAQFCGARSLREIETNLKSHAGKLYHL